MISLLSDGKFAKGFWVKGRRDGDDTVVGTLFKGDAEPDNTLCQWYLGYFSDCGESYDLLNGKITEEGSRKSVSARSAAFTSESGALTFYLDAAKEFKSPRKAGEPWPHLLVEYPLKEAVPLVGLRSLKLKADYVLESVSSMENAQPALHAVQFPFYVKLTNINPLSRDKGRFLWFGVHLYDSRYAFTELYASADGGKEINTGAFIYVPSSKNFLASPVAVGKENNIDAELLPLTKKAYEEARKRGYLSGTEYADLAPTDGNFGFEITGSFAAQMKIKHIGLYAEKEKR